MTGQGIVWGSSETPTLGPCTVKVLGLDPSMTNFGWALHDTDGPDRCLSSGRFQTSSKTLFIDRYVDLREQMTALLHRMKSEHGIIRVGCESPVFGESYSEGLYGLYLYNCEAMRSVGVDVVFLSPGQIKEHAFHFLKRPKGWKMNKPDMVEAAKLDAGMTKNLNHNEADAYWAARIAGRFWQLHAWALSMDELTPTERRQFGLIHTYSKGKKAGDTERKGILYREDERFFLWGSKP